MTRRLHLDHTKREVIGPRRTRHRTAGVICMADRCRSASIEGRMCGRHLPMLLAMVNEDLAAAGLGPASRAVANDNGYVNAEIPGLGRRLVHRAVMEAVLGRPLTKIENVHHLNALRYDNHPDNLELWVRSQPYGSRAVDKAAWARKILAQYGTAAERRRYGVTPDA